MERLLITGAAGRVGTMLRPRLARPGRVLRLLDPRPVTAGHGEELVHSLSEAVLGVDAIVHLGGIAGERDARTIIESHALGTYDVLEAARVAGVSRVVLPSSNHAVGFVSSGDRPVPADAPGRPDTLYGWSKIAMESIGRLYADRFDMDVICLRIGSWRTEPEDLRMLATWLSADDGARLIEACLSAEKPGYRMVWGISRNTRRWASLAEGEALGYQPRDDAEDFAEALIAKYGEPDFVHDPALNRVGGRWCDIPLGQ